MEQLISKSMSIVTVPNNILRNENIISTIWIDDTTTDDTGDSPPQIFYHEAHS